MFVTKHWAPLSSLPPLTLDSFTLTRLLLPVWMDELLAGDWMEAKKRQKEKEKKRDGKKKKKNTFSMQFPKQSLDPCVEVLMGIRCASNQRNMAGNVTEAQHRGLGPQKPVIRLKQRGQITTPQLAEPVISPGPGSWRGEWLFDGVGCLL